MGPPAFFILPSYLKTQLIVPNLTPYHLKGDSPYTCHAMEGSKPGSAHGHFAHFYTPLSFLLPLTVSSISPQQKQNVWSKEKGTVKPSQSFIQTHKIICDRPPPWLGKTDQPYQSKLFLLWTVSLYCFPFTFFGY